VKRILVLVWLGMTAGYNSTAQTRSTPRTDRETRPPWQLPAGGFVQVMGHRIHYYGKGSGPAIQIANPIQNRLGNQWGIPLRS
jgi:hypothetical protein